MMRVKNHLNVLHRVRPRKKIFSKTAADRGFYHDTVVSIRHTAV